MTASDDETCKIWDSRRLEKDISFRSKLTYASQVQRFACSGSARGTSPEQWLRSLPITSRLCLLGLSPGTPSDPGLHLRKGSKARSSSGVVWAQGGKILACAACEDSQSVASASSSGSVHVWRVEYTSRSGGAPDRYTGIIGK